MTSRPNWSIIGPVALILAVIGAVIWFDMTTGGEAKPGPPLGAIGTPVRLPYLSPTPTPLGAPTAAPRPTLPPGAPIPQGTSQQRDATRRTDLLVLLNAANEVRARDGSYPSTHGNVQTVCKYKTADVGCALASVLPNGIPADPLGNQNGFWYQSDGTSVKIYASLENPIDNSQKCPTTDPELVKHANLICVSAP